MGRAAARGPEYPIHRHRALAVRARRRGGHSGHRPQLPRRWTARRSGPVQQMSATMAAPVHAQAESAFPTVLEVHDLTTHFPVRAGVVKAVDGVSFTRQRGKTLCVGGESGSGKSVTARSILQIVDAPGRIVSGSMILHRENGTSVDLAKLNPRGKQIRA